jgi:phosphate:Na+ symporter
MVLMTDGLKAVAGDSLRSVLTRFTGGPVSAVLAGATVTAVVQSSSATVLTTIGFVSAGLLTFAQSVGVIFGANLGTTSTGWLVALLGLRFSIAAIALPMVGLGALLRLLTRGRAASAGMALAGFGLIFVGIDVLQGGMETLAERFDPGTFPGATIGGRLMLVGIGIAMTVVMQSSSAAVATTLTALYSGTIGVEQAAALVVGQSVGTTVTAAIAVIGGSVGAKRTAAAHIFFNLVTGTIGFLIISPAVFFGTGVLDLDPAILIAAFLTGFKFIGMVILMPFIAPFSQLVMRAVPDRGPQLTRNLDDSVLELPAVAVETARRTTMDIAAVLVRSLRSAVGPGRHQDHGAMDAAQSALEAVRSFLGRISSPADTGSNHRVHLSVLHAMDHLERLLERLRSSPGTIPGDEPFGALCRRASGDLEAIATWLETGAGDSPEKLAEDLSLWSAELRRSDRAETLELAALGGQSPEYVLAHLDAIRWLDSALYHVWRATFHLAVSEGRAEVERAE